MSSDIQIIEIPKWGLSMEEGTVNNWLVNEGDSFTSGTELAEIESSKIVNVLEAHCDGTLRRILAPSGTTLPVGSPIAVAATADLDDKEIDAFVATLSGGPAAEPTTKTASTADSDHSPEQQPVANQTTDKTTASKTTQVPDSLTQGDDDSDIHATLHARKMARELGINLHNITASGRNNRISRRDLEQAIIDAGGSVAPPTRQVDKPGPDTRDANCDDSQVAATPVARRLAAELGINLHDCRASGSRGRVSKADVEAAQRASGTVVATATQAAAEATTQPTPSSANKVVEIPMDGMRRTIAARLQESKQTAPHFRLTVEADIDRLLAVRKKLNSTDPAAKVSVNDFLIKAAAIALTQVPECNVQFTGDTILRFNDADIAVAVALESGLITPIVKAANTKGLVEISNEVRALITKAKAGTLAPDEFQGGTFSISNLGMFGVKQFDAIINPPQGAILAVGSGEQRMVVRDGEAAIATLLTLTLSCDHRVIDGALGARLLQKLKWLVENPAMMAA